MIKKQLLLVIILVAFVYSSAFAQVVNIDPVSGEDYGQSCTSLLVGKIASTDGSTMTTHSCDGNYRTWSTIVPRKKFAAEHRDSIIWGLLKTEEPHDYRNTKVKGTIPSVTETYAYLNTGYPCMNEMQLAIGETTFGGRKELRNEEGLFLIEELQRIALQRTKTAREAIKLIGELVAEYGYGDGGECLTFADPHEVWFFEIVGSGSEGKPAAMWVAQRIPDDHIAVSANIPRISTVDFKSPDFMYSQDIRERAKALGLWDGKEPFKFWKVVREGKPFAIRDFFILNSFAPSLGLSMDMDELPISVKPEHKVSPQRAISIYRETYEGTPYDMSQNLKVTIKKKDDTGNETSEVITSPLANNWMSADFRNLINEIKPGTIEFQRTVGVCWCAYSQAIQCRSWLPNEIGAVAYFSVDSPGQSPRIPIYSGALSLPKGFDVCGQKRYRTDAVLWKFREANRLAQVSWGKARPYMEAENMRLEKKLFEEQPRLEAQALELIKSGDNMKARELITKYTEDFAGTTFRSWDELKAKYWEMFARGF